MDEKTIFAMAEMMRAAYRMFGVEVDVIDVTILRTPDLGWFNAEETEQ